MKRIKPDAKITAVEKLTDLLVDTEDPKVAVLILQAIDMLCEMHQMEMPEEAVKINIELDVYFVRDVLTIR